MSNSVFTQNVAGYPDVTVPHSEKLKEEYGLAWAKAINDDWFGGGSHVTQTNSTSSYFRQRFQQIEENRAYAAGLQRSDIYKQWLNETGTQSYLALDYRNISIIPKFVKLIVDFVMGLPETISIQAVDELALTSKEEYKNELIERMYSKDLIAAFKETFGENVNTSDFIPENMEEIDMHLNLNFKQSIEIAMEQAVNLILKTNDYPTEIKRQILTDLVENSFACTKTYADPNDGIKIDTVDIAYVVHSPSKYPDMRDIFYAGELRQMSAFELKRLTGNRWDDAKWKEVAEKHSGRIFDGTSDSSRNTSPYIDGYTLDYNKAFLDVLEFTIRVPNKKKYEKKVSKYGNEDVFEKNDDYEPPKESKYHRELIEHDYETCYSGKYIVGTDMIFDWEQQANVATDGRDAQKAKLPYTFYMNNGFKGAYRSYVDSMKPAADSMMLSWLKIQQVVSQAKPTSVAISIDSINNINLGGGEVISYGEAIDIYEATGRLYHKTRNSEGEWIGNGQPITPLPNEIKNLNELMATYNFAIEQIRHITGITREMEGIIGNRQSAKTVESSIDSSSSAISDIAHSYKSITKRVCDIISVLFQDIPVDHAIHKMYSDAIGASDMTVIRALEGKSLHSYGINITIETDLMKRIQLNQDINISLGQKEIKLEDAMEVRELAEQGNLNMAFKLLAYRRKKREKELMQQQERAQMIQMQMNIASSQENTKGQMAVMQMEMQAYQQKAAIDLKKYQMQKAIDAKVESELSIQDYMEELEITKLKVGIEDKKAQQDLTVKFATQRHQAELQKELIDKREQSKGKQNTSVTDMV